MDRLDTATPAVYSRAEEAAKLATAIHEFALNWVITDREAIWLIQGSGRGTNSR